MFTKGVQLHLISFYLPFIIEIHCLNIEKQFQRWYVLFDVKQTLIQFIPAAKNKFLKLGQYFVIILVRVFENWKLGRSATYTMG